MTLYLQVCRQCAWWIFAVFHKMVSIQLFFGHNIGNEFKLCKYFPKKLHHADYTLKYNSRWWEKKDLANFVLLKSIAPNSGFPRVLEASNKLKKRILYRMLHIHKPPTMTDHPASSPNRLLFGYLSTTIVLDPIRDCRGKSCCYIESYAKG